MYTKAMELEMMANDLTDGGILDKSVTSLTQKMIPLTSLEVIFNAIDSKLENTGNLKIGLRPEDR